MKYKKTHIGRLPKRIITEKNSYINLPYNLKKHRYTKFITRGTTRKQIPAHHIEWQKANGFIFIDTTRLCVHHINGNKRDDRIENLVLMPKDLHRSMHAKLYWNHYLNPKSENSVC